MASIVKRSDNILFPTFNSLWGDFFNRDFINSGLELGTSIPAVNTKETDNSYLVEMAVPGLNKQDINVNLDNNILTISSEKKDEKDQNDGDKVTRREFSYSSFQRSFQLPNNVNQKDVSANYNDGLLTVTLPKEAPNKDEVNKQIPIN